MRPVTTGAPTVDDNGFVGSWVSAGFQRANWSSAVFRFLIVLLLVYLAKQALTVIVFPPFTGHDEVAHYNYIGTVATEHRVPELLVDELPDYFYRYCRYILDWSPCEPENPRWLEKPFRLADWGALGIHPAGMQYAANHPPLYYLAAAPAYEIFSGWSHETRQYLIRTLSIPFGMMTVVLAFLTARAIFPADAFLMMTVPAFVAFQPQVSYEAAMVNNDIVGIAMTSVVLYLAVLGIMKGLSYRLCAIMGLALGLALLAKSTSIIGFPIVALAILLSTGVFKWRDWLPRGVVASGVAGLVIFPWYLYLWQTYGNLDGFKQVKTLQSPWNKPLGSFSRLLFNRRFVWNRWKETWGEFGWRRIHLDSTLLWVIAVPLIVAMAGLLLFLAFTIRAKFAPGAPQNLLGFENPTRNQVSAVVLLIFSCIIAYLAIIQFGTEFALTQARYYFPIVNAAAVLVMLGLKTLTPLRIQPIVRACTLAGLVLMNLVIYTQYAIPYWHIANN
jgi:4-amino-4-deoxy-L-arabinose transferase-like glycosyltransferase